MQPCMHACMHAFTLVLGRTGMLFASSQTVLSSCSGDHLINGMFSATISDCISGSMSKHTIYVYIDAVKRRDAVSSHEYAFNVTIAKSCTGQY